MFVNCLFNEGEEFCDDDELYEDGYEELECGKFDMVWF